ncbi:hypothetical protein ACFLMW_003743 [Salmonella enterica]
MKTLAIVLPVLLLAGCSTASSRMAECRDQGYSRNTCYQAEQNRQATRQAAIIGASEKQAMENAQALYSDDSREEHHHRKHHHKDY